MKSVYIATSLLNVEQARSIIKRFQKHNIHVTHDWTKHGQVFSERELKEFGIAEMDGVKNADLLFMIHPARTGTHVELGIALGCNKPVIIVFNKQIHWRRRFITWFNMLIGKKPSQPELKTFYFVPNVSRFASLEEAFNFALEKLL